MPVEKLFEKDKIVQNFISIFSKSLFRDSKTRIKLGRLSIKSTFDKMAEPTAAGSAPTANGKAANKRMSVERIYQKKSQLEHILLRPDTYIGSVQPVTEKMWVLDAATETIVAKEISYVPGLYKIFDEVSWDDFFVSCLN